MSEGIYALATPYGKSAIAIIRASKEGILNLMLPYLTTKKVADRKAILTYLYFDREREKLIDQLIMIYFPGKSSYSGVDTIEFHCHGSVFIVKEIFKFLQSLGFREASRGEFTRLAVLNGKMDLIQAEAINNLINSESFDAYEVSLRNLSSALSNIVEEIYQEILDSASIIESILSYPEEDWELENQYIDDIYNKVDNSLNKVEELLKNANYGISLNTRYDVVIVGPTNAGKSSLFNALLKKDRSIVSDIHGTTRDYIECDYKLDSFQLSLYDTAGLRKTEDKIELAGIKKVKDLIKEADCLIHILSIDDILNLYKQQYNNQKSFSKNLADEERLFNIRGNDLVTFELSFIDKINNKLILNKSIITVINKIDLILDDERIEKKLKDDFKKNYEDLLKFEKGMNIEKVIEYEERLQDILERIFYSLDKNHNFEKLFKDLCKHSYNLRPAFISIELGVGIRLLEREITNSLNKKINEDSAGYDKSKPFIQTMRQRVLFEKIEEYLKRSLQLLDEKEAYDMILENLRFSIEAFEKITGKDYTDEILDSIFDKFCLGK
ncbi:MAG: tRNA uridine-5-carboxymethylaminomethyl(34) synthesis GTPase MnmE [Spirochaetes bacterium]|nr:tRNA uridine-5-carboxymethylaminomethyl(34) synthesis GTPase MnmE [Spirochaetota bacterium]HOV45912.1 tRNA uridine-5-carboxymethylaminomethyl(34) synthesis GTPase MnmE [Exilispira sp.]MBP8990423.1 tRNA uridine-5-carboxymethylaminomethyl(34) synthesis GTPase MnmE [Spirochaetota bacterium]HPB47068.1 tRNA uridine-5-carboxymethylaminomethyl(34) synthesis GTPase MnmE [Exilispira sp.]HPO60749.1 tRNA uridine-5-carboxymethylaminomethyl(34) synthesis GTPase MnmE [Exilispira sp.]